MKKPDVESASSPSVDAESPLRFAAALAGNLLVFSVSLATVLTILLFGLRIIQHGLPVCGLLAQANLWHRVLHTSCGCALVELILLPLAGLWVWGSAPGLFRRLARIRRWGQGER